MFRQFLGVSIFVLFFCSMSWGLDPDKPIEQYLIDQWELADGIPSNTINSIKQTPDGYLWIATQKGLIRFDGMRFSAVDFIKGAESPIPHTLFVDREGTLWIGGSGSLTSYRYRTRRFDTFAAAEGIVPDRIRCIKDDMKGNLWIGFWASYVNRFTGGRFTAFNASHGLQGKKINAVVERADGNLLFGSREKGVFMFKEDKFVPYPVAGLEDVYIIFLYEDRKGELWIGTTNGLFRVSETGTKKYTTADGLSNNYITRMTEDGDRNFWVGTLKGLNRLKREPDGVLRFEPLLESFIITCLFEDREGSLWVGTYNSGVKRLKDGKFISYAPLEAYAEEILQSVFQDRRGDTWIGTLSGKLFRCRGSDVIETLEPPELTGTAISSIAADDKGNLWLGTNGKGVFKKSVQQGAVPFTTENGLADNLVTSISKDSRGSLWCCTFDGVSRITPNNNGKPLIQSLNSGGGLAGKVAHNVYEDRDRNIWIAADKGITILKDGKMEKDHISHLLPGVSVTCIYEDPSAARNGERVFWAATHGAGLKRLKAANSSGDFTVTGYTTAQGMTTNFIYRFFEDTRGNFWLMSNSGILRVGKHELNRFADGGAAKEGDINCTSFGISDGMKSLEFNNEFSRSSALKAQNGEFWFITKKGISIVDPARVKLNKFPPPVVIETVLFDGQPIPGTPRETLAYKGVREFVFRFTAPTFLYPEKVKFKYRLEGFDADWISLAPGAEREARYTDPYPGPYTFRVIAANSEGVWNRNGDSMTFTLRPFFYQTPLFRIAVLLLLAALAAAVYYLVKEQPFKKRKRYKDSPLEPAVAEECIKKLRVLMDIKKVYKDPDISLQSLAEKLSVSHHLLSQVLNEKLDCKFFDYIHRYRIEEARGIMREPGGEDLKIAAVAYDVGFNTVPAFYKAFKKFTGMTPTEYKKKTAPPAE
jgi:ligand-binding sensor domain-containing protein/AraC-like DNA-binding protein